MPRFLLTALFAAVGFVNPAVAGEPWFHWWPWRATGPACPTCPEDYCSKCLPAVPCAMGPCGPNDYCPKTLPTVCPVKCFGANDYCSKALPALWKCCYPPWFTCGSASCAKPAR
jgi:hypothetical protein